MTKNSMSSMTFRLDADLQAAFAAACKASDLTAAQVLRAAMRDYVAAASLKGAGHD
jgi:predicted transcriptional regulator